MNDRSSDKVADAPDDTAGLPPAPEVIQMEVGARLPWFEDLAGLPTRTGAEQAQYAEWAAAVVSHQHPDHDTPA